MRRGILCIGTGRYSALVPALEDNIATRGSADVLFVLTDDADLLGSPRTQRGDLEVLRVPWGSLGWPRATLYRYHAMRAHAPLLRDTVSHLVYSDVDMRFVGDVGALFSDEVVAVRHPGFWQSPVSDMPFESDPRSAAHVPPECRTAYVAGGVQGGPVEAYLAAAEECAAAVTQDHLRGITAVWHDESHWNRYVSEHPEVRLLGAEYCWAESWELPAGLPSPRLLALDKDHHWMRGTTPPYDRLRRALQRSPLVWEAARSTRRLVQQVRQR